MYKFVSRGLVELLQSSIVRLGTRDPGHKVACVSIPLFFASQKPGPRVPRFANRLCASSSRLRGTTDQGFTLIELLVVLVLIGLLMAIAVPNIRKVYTNFQDSLVQDEIEKQLRGLPFKSFIDRKGLDLTKMPLPQGFKITEGATLGVRADGICTGGQVEVASETQKFVYNFTPPLCVPELIEKTP